MLNNSTKRISVKFTNLLYNTKKEDVLKKHITKRIFKPIMTKRNLDDSNGRNEFFTKAIKKNFSEKSKTEDLIEQILQSKANNGKKTFVSQENANLNASSIYSKSNSNNANGYSTNYNKNSYPSNNNNGNGNNFQNNYNNNQYAKNGNQGNDIDHIIEREANSPSGNGNFGNGSSGENQNHNNGGNNYNQNNASNANSNSGNNINNNNEGNNNNNYQRKRNRISIIRDGMNITLILRRVIIISIIFKIFSLGCIP